MLILRQENAQDYEAVFQLVEAAFKEMPFSDGTEQHLVNRLRLSDAFIPELSIVAEQDGQIVGHILLSKIEIQNDEKVFPALSLAPVSVLPAFHNRGIGSQLIHKAHDIARSLGHELVLLIGHASYYPRFGYEIASKYNIRFPFDIADEHCMVCSLTTNGLEGVQGMVEYPKAFYE